MSDGRSEWPENLALTLGAPAPATTWLFADNRPIDEGVETSFVAFNPGTTDADLEVYVEIDGQSLAPTVEPFVVTVRAGQYAQVPIGTDNRIPVGFGAFVVAVSRNDVPIVVERVVEQSEPADPDGAAFTIGSPVLARDWLVPVGGIEGQESMQVSIANPSVSEAVTLAVEAVGSAGRRRRVARHHEEGEQAHSPTVLRLGVLTWTRLHGIVSLELAGVFSDMELDAELLLRTELRQVVDAAS